MPTHDAGRPARDGCHPAHRHTYSTWHWTSDRALSLSAFRSFVESLAASVYRAKGLIQLREDPQYSVEFQLAGRRSSLSATGLWGDSAPRSRIVMIGVGDSVDTVTVQQQLDACTRAGDDAVHIDWRQLPTIQER